MSVDELIEKIINGEYIVTEQDLINYPELRQNFEVMKKAIDVNCNFVRYAEIRCYGRRDIASYAIEKGFVPSSVDVMDNRYLRTSTALKNLYRLNSKKIEDDIINRRHLVTAEDLINYHHLRDNFEVMLLAVEQNCNLIAYANQCDNIEILAQKALEKGYIPRKEDFMLSSKLLSKITPFWLGRSDLLMQTAIKIDPKMVCFNIKYVDYAFQCGLQITKELLDEWPNLLSNNKIFKLALDINPNYMENAFLKKSDDYDYDNTLTIENLKYAIKNGYIPTPELVKLITDFNPRNKEKDNINQVINELLIICIDSNPNAINGCSRYIDENILQYAINKGYVPELDKIKDNSYLMDSTTIGNFILKQNEDWQNNKFLKEYIEKYSSTRLSANIINKIWPFISKKEIYDVFNFEEILNIVQYIYLSYKKTYNFHGKYTGKDKSNYSELKQNLETIIDNGNLKKFNLLINIFANDYPTKEKIDLMQEISSGFISYENLINDLFTKEKISKQELYLLKQILTSEEITNINSIDELNQYSQSLFQKRKVAIDAISESDEYEEYYYDDDLGDSLFCMLYEPHFGEMKEGENEGFLLIQDQILKMLCNISLIEYLYNIHYDFNSKHIETLIEECNNKSEKEELENYKIIIEFIESILKCRDFNALKKIAHKLNECLYKNNDYILPIYESFNKLIIEKRLFFGNELSQNLTNIESLTASAESNDEKKYIRQNNKFTASNRELYGEKLDGKTVDFIELQGTDFVFLTHVLNAYGEGAQLLDFKYPRLLGRPHICLSAIGDNCVEMTTSKIDKLLGGNTPEDYTENYAQERTNYVTLLFDKFDKEQLALMSYGDLASFSVENSLDIKSAGRIPKFMTTQYLLAETNDWTDYNECVLYRRDSKGNYLYPSAIITREKQPTQYEIDAAAYLGIPIVYINKEYYLNTAIEEKTLPEEKHDKPTELKEQLMKLKDLLEISSIDKKSKNR